MVLQELRENPGQFSEFAEIISQSFPMFEPQLAQEVWETIAHDNLLIQQAQKAQNNPDVSSLPIPIPTPHVLEKTKPVVNTIFGSRGYLQGDIKAKRHFLTAYTLMLYGHQNQFRKTLTPNGEREPYVIHCVEVASMDTQVKQPIADICADFTHDLAEDTTRPDKSGNIYPFPVTNSDIGRFLGIEVQIDTEGLTDVRKPHKQRLVSEGKAALGEKNRAATTIKIFDSPPSVQRKKIHDRLHNMRTLYGKKPEDHEPYAADTWLWAVPLAQKLGMQDVARELDDLCFRYSLPALRPHDHEVYRSQLEEVQKDLTHVQFESMNTYLDKEISKSDLGMIKVFEPVIPTISEIDTAGGNPYVEISIVLDDFHTLDYAYGDIKGYYQRVETIYSLIRKLDRFQIAPGFHIEDLIDPLIQSDSRSEIIVPMYYICDDGQKVLTKIKISDLSTYGYETTSLAYLTALDLTDADQSLNLFELETRKRWAETKYKKMQEELAVARKTVSVAERYRIIIEALSGGVVVTLERRGKKIDGEEFAVTETQTIVPHHSTLLDLLMTVHPRSWQTVLYAIFNNKRVNPDEFDATQVLHPGDKIYFALGHKNANTVMPEWFDAVSLDQFGKKADKIRTQLKRRIKPQLFHQRIDSFKQEIRDRGKRILLERFAELDRFDTGYPAVAAIFPNNDPAEFFLKLGLEIFSAEIIDQIERKLREFWHNLYIISVYVPNKEGMLEQIGKAFAAKAINIMNIDQRSDPTIPGSAWVICRIYKDKERFMKFINDRDGFFNDIFSDSIDTSQSAEYIKEYTDAEEFRKKGLQRPKTKK